MGCLLVVMSAAMPRFGLFLFWILRPARVDAAFDTFILPLIGFLFFPLATLLYAVLWTTGGLNGWEWFWVVIAGFFDLVNSAASAARRQEVTSYRFS